MDIYNEISKYGKIKHFEIAFLLIITFLSFYFYKNLFSNINASFYILSSIIQGFLALIGFLGTVTIYKLQLIENEAEKVSSGLEEFIINYNGTEVRSYSWIEMMNTCKKILDNPNNTSTTGIKKGYERLCELQNQKQPIQKSMVDFSLLSMVNVIISLMGIPLSSFFIENRLICLNAILIIIVFLLSYYCIKGSFKTIRKSVGYSFTTKI
ncbi:hypothetical protein M0R01_01800 [bacterium]|nr:hypothetical protein [bacterium]